jgi:hypothetical protein
MFIANQEKIQSDKFYCKSKNLKIFLVEGKQIPFVSKIYDEETKKCTWIFIRTIALDNALKEWKRNKVTGELYIKK